MKYNVRKFLFTSTLKVFNQAENTISMQLLCNTLCMTIIEHRQFFSSISLPFIERKLLLFLSLSDIIIVSSLKKNRFVVSEL